MILIRTLAAASALALAAVLSPAAAQRPSDVVADASIRRGALPNGMHYAIQRNTTPLGGASVRMRVDLGSTAEAEDQRGLAHFLEHMAFNGSKGVPEGEMIKILERYGLAFGADTNASTGFTETVYKLDLPRAAPEIVDTALRLMRETASELTLDQKAIDRERGIILSEKRARDQYGLRRLEHYLNFTLPGTPVATRLPIGTAEVIRAAPAERLRDLYTRFYTPDRTTLAVVGDIDPAEIEAKIRARFADWRGSGAAEGDPELKARIDPARPRAAAYFRDPDVPASIAILAVRPAENAPDTLAKRFDATLESLGNAMLSRRLSRIARAEDAPINGGSASSGELFNTADYAALNVNAKGENWRDALELGERELRRALLHGFTRPELAEQLANLRTGYENAARAADTRRSETLADGIVAAIEDGRIVTTPAYRLQVFEQMAPRITVEAVDAAFRARWTGPNRLVHVSGKSEIDKPEATILAALGESAKVAVAPLAESGAGAFAYNDFGAPGRVVEDRRVADLDIRLVRFANNVRLNLKKTDFEKDRVRVSIRIGGGALEFGKDKPGLAMFMNSAFAAGGLQKHRFDDLQSVLAGRSVSPGIGAGAETFAAAGATTPRDLLLQLQLTAAYLTAPGFRPESEAQWRRLAPVLYDTLDASPGAVVGRDVARLLADNDPRFGVPALAELEKRNLAELRAATARAFADGPIEIAIVGDIDEAAVIDAVGKTFGALAPRRGDPEPLTEARAIRFRADRTPIVLRHAGKADEAQALAYWPTTDDRDHGLDVRLSLLAAVMQLTLTEELRETLGATYSPNAFSATSSVYPGYGQFGVSSNLDPKDIPAVEAAVERIAGELRDKPVDADLLLRARTPILEAIDKSRRENGTWIALLDEAQTEPRWLDRFRAQKATYQAVTPADLQAVARRYLTPGGALKIRVVAEGVAP